MAISTMSWRRPTHQPAEPESELLERLRDGDQQAFLELVAHHQDMLLRLACSFVPNRAIAEEVVQDTWLGMLRGLDGFMGHSSFKTWLLRILVNRARSTGALENRSVAIGDAVPAVDRSRFDVSGAWMSPPQHWIEDLEDRMFAADAGEHIRAGLQGLPARQREVVMLRDVDGLDSDEVCEVLDISEANQRVLLHRGRSRLRQFLEAELGSA